MTLILESLSYLHMKGSWKSKNSFFDNITSQLNCGSATSSVDGNGTSERACGWRQLIYFVTMLSSYSSGCQVRVWKRVVGRLRRSCGMPASKTSW
jgi:hypothetical protein